MRQVTRLFASVFKEYVEAFRLFSSNARLYLLGSLLLGIGTNMVQLLLNLYLQRLAFGEAAIGSVLSLRALGSFVVALPASFIVARADSRLLLASAAFLSAVSYTGQALASTYGPMAAAVLFSGAFSSLYQVAGGPFFMKNSGPTERIHLFALNSALGMGTGLIGSLAGGALKDFVFTVSGDEVYAYRAALVLGALFVGAAMAPFLGIREPVSGSAGGPAPGRRAPLGRINVGLFARLL
ncbi:MAG TPA: hypothetical protein PK625_06135, partial [Spirochaetales bacterium]|nr:hypothetical protein [Spirochaetales bacterium]